MPLHPDKAARLTLLAQIGAVAAGGLAVVAWIMHPTPPAPPEVEVPKLVLHSPQHAKVQPPPAAHADWTEVAPTLAWATPPNAPSDAVAGAPKPEDATKQGGPVADKPHETDTPPFPLPSWRYVGFASQDDSLLALLSIDGRQHFVTKGQTIAGFLIDGIDTDHIDVSLNGVAHRLNIIQQPKLDPHAVTPMFREAGPRGARSIRPPAGPRPTGAVAPNPAADREKALDQARQQSGERPQR